MTINSLVIILWPGAYTTREMRSILSTEATLEREETGHWRFDCKEIREMARLSIQPSRGSLDGGSMETEPS